MNVAWHVGQQFVVCEVSLVPLPERAFVLPINCWSQCIKAKLKGYDGQGKGVWTGIWGSEL